MNGFNKKHSGIFGLKIVIPFLMAFFVCKGVANGQIIQNIPSDNSDVHQWVEQHFAKGKIPPFSFVYGGKNSNSFIKFWEETGRNSESIPAIQKRIQDYKNLRPYFYADYYSLNESVNYQADSVWLAYQLNRPEKNGGIIIVKSGLLRGFSPMFIKLVGL